MNKVLKGAMIFTSGAVMGTLVGSLVGGLFTMDRMLRDTDIRESIKMSITHKIEKFIFGEQKRPTPVRVTYKRYYKAGKTAEPPKTDRYRFDDIVFESMDEAIRTLSDLNDIIAEYNVATVADLYDLVSHPEATNYMDNRYGWTNLVKAEVKRSIAGYYIDFPPAKEI